MKFKKHKFWDYKKTTLSSFLLLPITILIKFVNLVKFDRYKKNIH